MDQTTRAGIPADLLAEEEHVIDLRGHRLGDLVQALTGCRPEDAELAVGAAATDGRVSADEALETVARAMVQVRRRTAPSTST